MVLMLDLQLSRGFRDASQNLALRFKVGTPAWAIQMYLPLLQQSRTRVTLKYRSRALRSRALLGKEVPEVELRLGLGDGIPCSAYMFWFS